MVGMTFQNLLQRDTKPMEKELDNNQARKGQLKQDHFDH